MPSVKTAYRRTSKPVRSKAQKKTSALGLLSAKLHRNENSDSTVPTGSKRRCRSPAPTSHRVPSPPLPLTSAIDRKTIKSLSNSVHYLKTTLKKSRSTVLGLKDENRRLQVSSEDAHSSFALTAQQLLLSQHCLEATQAELVQTKKAASSSIFSSNAYLAWVDEDCARVSTCHTLEVAQLETCNRSLVSKVQALRKDNRCSHSALRRERRRRPKHACVHHVRMRVKGAYTSKSRAMMRTLVSAGCAQKHVGTVIKSVGSLMGVELDDTVSRRSVRRAVIEGGIASIIQVGHAIATSKSITLSDDATTHRHVNYESRHIAVRPSSLGTPQIFFIGVEAATDHSSETQLRGWLDTIAQITSVYSNSPYAVRAALVLSNTDVALKLRGTNGDHAADQKKKHSMLYEWKMSMTQTVLGSRELSTMSQEQLVLSAATAMLDRITAIGGQDVWNRISPLERNTHEAEVARNLALQTGMSAYSALPDIQKREYELFFRGGCCMHKDLNAVKGGDKEMSEVWMKIGVPGPIILPNKDNNAIVNDLSSSVRAHTRVLELSGRGGVKTTSIAGALFNNKDKKKGQQDTYCWYFFNVLGYPVKFPDTSNTRYGSHCDAAAELIAHLPIYIEFLEFIRDKKERAGHTNIEQNLCQALQCPATLTELCVLALYGQTVSLPYMAVVRGPEATLIGVLDMGPTQMRVIKHVESFRDQLGLFTDSDASPEQSTFDGNQWRSNEVFYAIKALLQSLPHFNEALHAFLNGALTVWKRFSDDYNPDGYIGMATPQERQGVYMPPTNDRNEGALGTKRQDARTRPNHSSLSFNSIVSLKHNRTEEFIALELSTLEDVAYLRSTARKLDSAGLEAKKRAEQIVHDNLNVTEKRKKATEKAERIRQVQVLLDGVILSADLVVLARESKEQLELRLKRYRQLIYETHRVSREDFEIPVQSRIKRKADRISNIVRCHEKYLSLRASFCQTSSSELIDCSLLDVGNELESDHEMDFD